MLTDTQTLQKLPEIVAQTMARRTKLQERANQIAMEEKSHRDLIKSAGIADITLVHPLEERLREFAADVIADFNAKLPLIKEAAKTVAACDQRIAKLLEEEKVETAKTPPKSKLKLIFFVILSALWFFFRDSISFIPHDLNWVGPVIVLGVGIILKIAQVRVSKRFQSEQTSKLTAIKTQAEDEGRKRAQCVGAVESARAATISAYEGIVAAGKKHIDEICDAEARTWETFEKTLPSFLRGEWDRESWEDYQPVEDIPYMVAMWAREKSSVGNIRLKFPVCTPLVGRNGAMVIDNGFSDSSGLLHALILQQAAIRPYGVTFCLLDPATAGQAFPMQRGLPFVRKIGADIARELETVMEDITRIISTYIDDRTVSFEQLPKTLQANERFEIICAANFPDGYDRRSIELLQKIAKNGPVSGKYLFIHKSDKAELPRDMNWEDFGPLTRIVAGESLSRFNFANFDKLAIATPKGGAQRDVIDKLVAAKPPETKIEWESLHGSDESKWWGSDASSEISTPVGSCGTDRNLNLWFGENRDGRPCAHGALGAMTGSGKSNLYHALICGLATQYAPDELSLYLIDGKVGVEFQAYRRLPHARVVALHSNPELSRSVLDELLEEMRRRNEVFKKFGLSDFKAHRAANSPGGKFPRILLMIDEYQELFEGDRDGQASERLRQIAAQGRSAGIHMLLGSQRFGAPGMLHQTAIFANIHLRVAMKMSLSDIQGLSEFGRNGKRLIEQCDLPGKVVVNDRSGDDKANDFGKVALITRDKRTAIIEKLIAKARSAPEGTYNTSTVVFDGDSQPDLIENTQLDSVLRSSSRPCSAKWKSVATTPVFQRGLGVSDWFDGETPYPLWIGQELNVHGQAMITLRRRPAENILIAGENQSATYGMLTAILTSFAVRCAHAGTTVRILDRAIPGTPWSEMTEMVTERLLKQTGLHVERSESAGVLAQWLASLEAEIERRNTIDEEEQQRQPSILFVLAGAERLTVLAKSMGKFGAFEDSVSGASLKRILRNGPQVGIHTLMTFPGAGEMKSVFERGQIDLFRHRVVTRVSENDSFLLIGRDTASKLDKHQAMPAFAVLHNATTMSETRFKPYAAEAQTAWSEQLERIGVVLNSWNTEAPHVHG